MFSKDASFQVALDSAPEELRAAFQVHSLDQARRTLFLTLRTSFVRNLAPVLGQRYLVQVLLLPISFLSLRRAFLLLFLSRSLLHPSLPLSTRRRLPSVQWLGNACDRKERNLEVAFQQLERGEIVLS